MVIRPIRLFGDPILLTEAEPVTDFDRSLRQLVKDLSPIAKTPSVPGFHDVDAALTLLKRMGHPRLMSGDATMSRSGREQP